MYICCMHIRQRAKLARLFHALSDETRLEILERLRNGEQCVCELTDYLQAAQSRLSFHLKVLKEAGFIRDRPEGRWIYYAWDARGLQCLVKAAGMLTARLTVRDLASGCC